MSGALLNKFFGSVISPPSGTIGVCRHPEGLAVARLLGEGEAPPRLAFCHLLPARSEEESRAALHRLVTGQAWTGSATVGVMPPGSYSLLQIEPPEVPREELRDALRWQVKDLVDFPLEEAVLDLFPVPNPSGTGRSRLAYAVVARKSRIERETRLLHQGRLEVRALDIAELALRNLAARLPDNSQGVALLYLEAHRGLIVVVQNSILFLARSLSVGSADLLPEGEEIATGNVSRLQLEALGLELQRSLDFFESHFSQVPLESLVVLPTAPELPALVPYLREHLTQGVRSLDLASLLKTEVEFGPGLQARCLLAVGGALREGEG